MTRQLIIAATIAIASISAGSHTDAGCGSHGCHKRYGRYTAQEAFILFRQHPELIQRFPQIARELQTEFGAIEQTTVETPAAQTPPAAVTTPATQAAQEPAAAATPAVADPAEETPAAVATGENAPVETPPEDAVPVIEEVDPDSPPADLPVADPPPGL